MTFDEYSGSATDYIREYLIPRADFEDGRVANEDEAHWTWEALEDTFRSDGGTGIDCDTFVEAIMKMYEVES